MIIKVEGKISLSAFNCFNCQAPIMLSNANAFEVCDDCGGKYKRTNVSFCNNKVEVEFMSDGFGCLEQGYFAKCNNSCPGPNMYCKEHSNDDALDRAKQALKSSEETVRKREDRIRQIKESRKTWAISKLSGLDNE